MESGCVFDVRRFGAAGDGKTKETGAIQRTVDACAAAGGGRVLVPPGTYLTGTVRLRSNVDFHLAPGAVVLGSPDLADYNADDAYPQNGVFTTENVTGAHLVIALETTNTSITGHGRIDGNGAAFFGPLPPGGKKFPITGRRPGQMVCFVECANVRVRDVSLDNAPYWTLFLHGCRDVSIRGVRIFNPPETRNGDGIDVDCCADVTISDCVIRSGDDCITLRGVPRLLKDPAKTCRNVAVANCVLSTPCNAIRVGVGDGSVRDAVFSNIVVTETRNGICLIGNYKTEPGKGCDIENVLFSNMTMETLLPIYIWSGRGSTCRIRNIRIADVRASGGKACFISGMEGAEVSSIRLRDIDLEMSGGRETIGADADLPKLCREWDKGRPAAICCSRAADVRLERVRVRWGRTDGPWRKALLVEDADVAVRECDLPDPPAVG